MRGGTPLILAAGLAALSFSAAGLPIVLAACSAQEEEIQISDLPQPVRAAAQQFFQTLDGATAEKEVEGKHTIYEVIREVTGRDVSLTLAADGQILEVEREIPAADLAPGARKALMESYPDAQFKVVESIEERYFEVKLQSGGKSLEIQILATGEILEREEGKEAEAD